MVKQTGNEREQELLQQLRSEGKTVYSISRLNSFTTCQYAYYKTYVERNRGIGNPYSEIGTEMHDYLEAVHRGDITDFSDFNQKLHNKLLELEIMGLDFPSETIKKSFVADLEHFTKNFNKLDGEFTLEKMFISNVGDYYLMGFIDMIQQVDGKTKINDWKSSSKFSGASKLTEAGRQLVLYKLGLEQVSDMEIDSVMWGMLKYIYVCHKQKNGKIKKKMVNRGKLIKEMAKAFEKDMLASGMDQIEVGMTLLTAEQANDFNMLPQVIKDKYWLEDCFVEYEVTDEVIKEVEDYVTNTIQEIESKDVANVDEWKPVDFKEDGTFYCNTLCSHRMSCEFIKQYKKDNPFSKGY